MIGCKVMRTLASVEFEIILILGLPCCLSSSSVRCLENAYLVGRDTESEPFEDHVETEAPESPHIVAPPTSLPDNTPPTLVPILRKTARMDVRVSFEMLPGLSASIAEVAAMSDLTFRKRFRSYYESSPSSSPPDLPSQKRYREDEDPAVGDEGLAAGDESPGIRVESLSLGVDEAVSEGQQRASPVVKTAMGQSSGSVLESERPDRVSALRQPTLTTWIDLDDVPSIVPSPISLPMIPLAVPSPVASPVTAETKGFLTELGARVEMQRGLIRDHTVRLQELSPAFFEMYDRDIRELFTRSGAVRDEIFSQRYRFRSLEHEQERVAVIFGAIWRPVLALESWAGQTDVQRTTLWHAISDTQRENQELRLQIAEERRARLDLAGIVDSMRIG
ncbi:hypothetical protein Tco_0613997 [Tanacetum coccineum]